MTRMALTLAGLLIAVAAAPDLAFAQFGPPPGGPPMGGGPPRPPMGGPPRPPMGGPPRGPMAGPPRGPAPGGRPPGLAAGGPRGPGPANIRAGGPIGNGNIAARGPMGNGNVVGSGNIAMNRGGNVYAGAYYGGGRGSYGGGGYAATALATTTVAGALMRQVPRRVQRPHRATRTRATALIMTMAPVMAPVPAMARATVMIDAPTTRAKIRTHIMRAAADARITRTTVSDTTTATPVRTESGWSLSRCSEVIGGREQGARVSAGPLDRARSSPDKAAVTHRTAP